MSTGERALRHLQLSARAAGLAPLGTPPFVILFINSICNLKCEHCFVWSRLNKRDDLTFDEIKALSMDLGPVENLNLSGGEPFMREEFAEVCLQFIDQNGTKLIYVPTNGYYLDKTIKAVSRTLEDRRLDMFTIELSLDGMPEFHNHFRGNPRSFEKVARSR